MAPAEHVMDGKSNEQQNAAKALRGDRQSLGALLVRYRPGLCARAFRILRNREDAEDVVQDAMLRAIEKLSTFEGRSQFSTWLTRIVINEALMRLRKRRRLPPTASLDIGEEGEVLDLLPGRDPSPEAVARGREMERHVARAISHLPPRSRRAFHLCAVEEWTVGEVAEELGVNWCTAKSQYHRARKRIALRMGHFSAPARSSAASSRRQRTAIGAA
ncbi:MAG TPA: RNA polymerase sigma factor [Candidatus Aquilonibacter sp.]|nr:RNA polymerase sigma factor [Candidatus Aquilonibacter sp.]